MKNTVHFSCLSCHSNNCLSIALSWHHSALPFVFLFFPLLFPFLFFLLCVYCWLSVRLHWLWWALVLLSDCDLLSQSCGRMKGLYLCLNLFGLTDQEVPHHNCVSLSEEQNCWQERSNGWLNIQCSSVFKCVFVLLSAYIWFSVCESMWLYPYHGP